jgi:hypothetical protein
MMPVVVVNLGNPEYLRTVIKQAEHFGNKVYLLGDATNAGLSDHFFANAYARQALEFQKIYVHLSSNDYGGELFCFQRWFVLLEFMKARGIEKCHHIDSDVLLYCNVEEDYAHYREYNFTLVYHANAGNSYFTLAGLEKFCDFVMSTYKNTQSFLFELMTADYHVRRKHNVPAAVSDMTFLRRYCDDHSGEIGEMSHIIDDAIWDNNINEHDADFEMKGGIKNIKFVNNFPTCIQTTTGKAIRFKSLHFQGPAKRLMNQYVSFPMP